LISLCTFAPFAGQISEFDLQNQFIGAACNVKRGLRLLAQQSSKMERSGNRLRRSETLEMNVKLPARETFGVVSREGGSAF